MYCACVGRALKLLKPAAVIVIAVVVGGEVVVDVALVALLLFTSY